jgi:hypothetical protein
MVVISFLNILDRQHDPPELAISRDRITISPHRVGGIKKANLVRLSALDLALRLE